MDFCWEFLLSLKNKGREIAEKWLAKDYKEVGLKSTFDVEEHFFDKFWWNNVFRAFGNVCKICGNALQTNKFSV